MKKPVVFGIILGVLAASSMAWAQAQTPEKGKKGHPKKSISKVTPHKFAKSSPVVNAKSSVGLKRRFVPQGVAGALYQRNYNLRPTYAQNTVGANTASDAGGGPTSPEATKLMVNPPLATAPATAGTTTSSVATARESTKKSAFSFKYRSYNAMNLDSIENPTDNSKDHEVQAWDRFNFSYNLNDNVSVSLMPQIFHTWFGDRDRPQSSSVTGLDQPYDFYVGDTGLYLIDSKLAQFGGFTLDGSQAYFFSTSEASLKAGTIGQTRSSLGLGRSIGRFDVKWTESFWYYMQQYQTSAIFLTNGLPMQNISSQLWSLLDLGLNVTKKFSINLEGGFMNQVTNPDDNPVSARPQVLADYIILDPEIDYSFNDHFSLGLGVWEQYDMRSQPTIVTSGTGPNAVPVAWLPQYYPFDYRNGSQAYLQTTIKF